MSAFASVTPPVSSLLDRKHETHREVPDICMCHIGCKCFVCVLCWIFPLLPPFFLPSVVSKWQMTLTFWHILSEARNRAGWRSPNIELLKSINKYPTTVGKWQWAPPSQHFLQQLSDTCYFVTVNVFPRVPTESKQTCWLIIHQGPTLFLSQEITV